MPPGDPASPPPAGGAPKDRAERWRRLQEGPFDLLVVGGGITGAGIASLASARRQRVALLEREDFGAGTSGATSKMLHGGLRYLAQGETRLVREALRERGLLLRHLGRERVQVTPFLLPLRGTLRERWKLRFGTWYYQRLAGDLSLGARELLSRTDVLRRVPFLDPGGLRGGVLYREGVVDDVLLTLTRVGEAVRRGAVVLNHAEAISPVVEGGKVVGVRMRDRLGGEEGTVRASRVVNAAGVGVRAWAGDERTPALRPSKGVHLVLRRAELPLEVAVVLSAPEGRWVFALPYGPFTIVGTTDTDEPSTPDEPRAAPPDVEYLLRVARQAFPGRPLHPDQLVDVYAGLRPLLAGDAQHPSELSREDTVHLDASGLLTVVGGKLTTHRAMAERALASPGGASGATDAPFVEGWDSWSFPPAWSGTPCPGAELVERALDVDGSARRELLGPWVSGSIEGTGAATLADLLDRRFHALQRLDPRFPALVEEVARLAAPELGWTGERERAEAEDYLRRVRSQTEAVMGARRSSTP